MVNPYMTIKSNTAELHMKAETRHETVTPEQGRAKGREADKDKRAALPTARNAGQAKPAAQGNGALEPHLPQSASATG
jgi:hypothetical protein